jgi:hypothetical protein
VSGLIGVAAALALVGAVAGSFLPGHDSEAELVSVAPSPAPALETEG